MRSYTNDTLSPFSTLIPRPVQVEAGAGSFQLDNKCTLRCEASPTLRLDIESLERYFVNLLDSSCGLNVRGDSPSNSSSNGGGYQREIVLALRDAPLQTNTEGYLISIVPNRLTIEAQHPAGLFWGIQTLRQLLPISSATKFYPDASISIPAGCIRDFPRFSYRGIMLDIARHFFSVAVIKELIDQVVMYKINHLHLHLSDDQGWRIMIDRWPNLALWGGRTDIDGGQGGFLSQRDYQDIVAYAAARFVVIVPEIDMPGHTQAAIASYPELGATNSCGGDVLKSSEVGLSSLDTRSDLTYAFIGDVLGELASLTPGPYLHIGGDEAFQTSPEDYRFFMQRAKEIVFANGKMVMGWEELATAGVDRRCIIQHWKDRALHSAAVSGARFVVSPSSCAYLDMKYTPSCELGFDWAGYIELPRAYEWDPSAILSGIDEGSILGVESPLWSETLRSPKDIQYMVFPRLLGHAEIGWSPRETRSWEEYRQRLAAHGPRLTEAGINFYRSPLVSWWNE